MARVKRKKKSTIKGQKNKWKFPPVNLGGLFYILFLFSVLLFSLGALGYVIFFRTVVAAELPKDIEKNIVFEEPLPDVKYTGQKNLGDSKSPRCAIIIDDMGYHEHIDRELLNLPLNLTFSFLPHAPYTRKLEEMAYQMDRTILLHLPLQPQDSNWDPGPGTLLLDDLDNQEDVFLRNLSMVPHATGVNNHMGSLYTENREAMESLLRLIARKKLFFIDSLTSSNSVGLEVARKVGVKAGRRYLFMDNVLAVGDICSQMGQLVFLAQKHGSAIGIAHPNVETLQALGMCRDILSLVQLVGVEELVH